MAERITKLLDKPSTKQTQQKTTPLSKLRMVQPPTSINRLQTPTNTQNVRLIFNFNFFIVLRYLYTLDAEILCVLQF